MTPSHRPEDFANALRSSLEPVASWFVVINHHEAQVFRSAVRGTVPELFLPTRPDDSLRHAHNLKDVPLGRENPSPQGFFGSIATALKDASEFLIFGSGTGSANESEQFIAWLKINRPDLSKRIIGSAIIDEHHLTAAQLLAKARDFYASPRAMLPPAT